MMLGLSHMPASPPPDHKLLFNHSSTSSPTVALTNPLHLKLLAREMEGPTVKKAPSLLEIHFQEQQDLLKRSRQEPSQTQKAPSQPTPSSQCCSTPTTSASTLASSASTASSMDTKVPPQTHSQPQPQSHPQSQTAPSPPLENPFLVNQAGLLDPNTATDPEYVQMVTRMAAYYQQRCQAILNYQQQRCQTWATSHRQKCQEMMQAAMLVVAWYIRDRIGRRRRRNKRAFRRGLRSKNQVQRRAGRGGIPTKGETVRKWVTEIPEAALSPNNGIRDESALDKDEREFDVEKEVTPDKDSQLFAVADQMIKSQLAKIDVPLLGALNLDDSESESESEDEAYYYESEDYELEDDEGDEEYADDDLDYEEDSELYVEDVVSKEAMHGTGKGSLKRKRSESTTGLEGLLRSTRQRT